MLNNNHDQVLFLVVVTDRKQKDDILTMLLDEGIHLINTVYGRGTVCEHFFMDAFGLNPERNKAVITCVSTYVKTEAALGALKTKFGFDRPNTGIAFTMPVDKVSF